MKRMPSKTLFRPWLLAGVWLLMGLVGLTGCRADSHAVAGAAGDNVREVELQGSVSRLVAQGRTDVVYVQQSGRAYARIEAPEQTRVKVTCHGAEVKITSSGSGSAATARNVVYVYAPEITEFVTSGMGSIELERGVRTARNVVLAAQSVGHIKSPRTVCRDLRVQINSCGNVDAGRVRSEVCRVSTQSSGSFRADQVRCDEARLAQSGSGNCSISQLDCGGDVYVDVRSSGSCSVSRLSSRGRVSASTRSSGSILLAGRCGNADYQCHSSGSIRADRLRARHVTARLTSVGSVYCNTDGRLNVECSSSHGGQVCYTGHPSRIEGSSLNLKRL